MSEVGGLGGGRKLGLGGIGLLLIAAAAHLAVLSINPRKKAPVVRSYISPFTTKCTWLRFRAGRGAYGLPSLALTI